MPAVIIIITTAAMTNGLVWRPALSLSVIPNIGVGRRLLPTGSSPSWERVFDGLPPREASLARGSVTFTPIPVIGLRAASEGLEEMGGGATAGVLSGLAEADLGAPSTGVAAAIR